MNRTELTPSYWKRFDWTMDDALERRVESVVSPTASRRFDFEVAVWMLWQALESGRSEVTIGIGPAPADLSLVSCAIDSTVHFSAFLGVLSETLGDRAPDCVWVPLSINEDPELEPLRERRWLHIAERAVGDPDGEIDGLLVLPPEELDLLRGYEAESWAPRAHRTTPLGMLRESARRNGSSIAIESSESRLSQVTLGRIVRTRGTALHEKFDVAPGETVGLVLGGIVPTFEMLLSIWSGGGAALLVDAYDSRSLLTAAAAESRLRYVLVPDGVERGTLSSAPLGVTMLRAEDLETEGGEWYTPAILQPAITLRWPGEGGPSGWISLSHENIESVLHGVAMKAGLSSEVRAAIPYGTASVESLLFAAAALRAGSPVLVGMDSGTEAIVSISATDEVRLLDASGNELCSLLGAPASSFWSLAVERDSVGAAFCEPFPNHFVRVLRDAGVDSSRPAPFGGWGAIWIGGDGVGLPVSASEADETGGDATYRSFDGMPLVPAGIIGRINPNGVIELRSDDPGEERDYVSASEGGPFAPLNFDGLTQSSDTPPNLAVVVIAGIVNIALARVAYHETLESKAESAVHFMSADARRDGESTAEDAPRSDDAVSEVVSLHHAPPIESIACSVIRTDDEESVIVVSAPAGQVESLCSELLRRYDRLIRGVSADAPLPALEVDAAGSPMLYGGVRISLRLLTREAEAEVLSRVEIPIDDLEPGSPLDSAPEALPADDRSRVSFLSAEVPVEVPEIPPVSELFFEAARREPDRTIRSAEDTAIPAGELFEQADTIAFALERRGIVSGEPVGLVVPFAGAFGTAAILGIERAGGMAVSVRPGLEPGVPGIRLILGGEPLPPMSPEWPVDAALLSTEMLLDEESRPESEEEPRESDVPGEYPLAGNDES